MPKILWFGKEKRKKKYGSKKQPKTFDEALDLALITKARKDGEWALNTALAKHGLMPEDDIEKVKKSILAESLKEDEEFKELVKQEYLSSLQGDTTGLLEKELEEAAIARLHEDPKLMERAITKRIDEMISSGDALSEFMHQYEAIKELEETMGGAGGGGISKGISDITKALLNTPVGEALAQRLFGTTVKKYIVQINGELREVTETEFKELQSQGLIQPIAALEMPKPEEKLPEEKVEEKIEEKVTEPKLPEFLSLMDLNQFLGYMEQTPEDFALQLEYEVQLELPSSIIIWNFLGIATYDKVVELVKPYRNHSQVEFIVQKILSDEGKVWLEEVIRLIKERGEK